MGFSPKDLGLGAAASSLSHSIPTAAMGILPGSVASNLTGGGMVSASGPMSATEQNAAAAAAAAQARALLPPQAAKVPTYASFASGMAGQGQAGGSKGSANTFLTGSSGIDPGLLRLGKTTLLGSS
ncbi:MAG: hypothetical protein AB3X46_09120 [Leptothrix ochracea]